RAFATKLIRASSSVKIRDHSLNSKAFRSETVTAGLDEATHGRAETASIANRKPRLERGRAFVISTRSQSEIGGHGCIRLLLRQAVVRRNVAAKRTNAVATPIKIGARRIAQFDEEGQSVEGPSLGST